MYLVLKDEYEFWDIYVHCSDQAKEVMEKISKEGKEDDFMEYIENYGVEYLSSVCDILHHEWQEVYKALGIKEE